MRVTNKNWESDGKLAKIFFSNHAPKHKMKNREFWSFIACREFKRAVAKSYPESWSKYVVMKNKYRVAHLYDMNTEETKKELEFYNEFET